jgi:hypothetical protein
VLIRQPDTVDADAALLAWLVGALGHGCEARYQPVATASRRWRGILRQPGRAAAHGPLSAARGRESARPSWLQEGRFQLQSAATRTRRVGQFLEAWQGLEHILELPERSSELPIGPSRFGAVRPLGQQTFVRAEQLL